VRKGGRQQQTWRTIMLTGIAVIAVLFLMLLAGPPLRALQRWEPMQPASRFSTRDRRPHRSHLSNERKGGPAPSLIRAATGTAIGGSTPRTPTTPAATPPAALRQSAAPPTMSIPTVTKKLLPTTADIPATPTTVCPPCWIAQALPSLGPITFAKAEQTIRDRTPAIPSGTRPARSRTFATPPRSRVNARALTT